MGIEPTFADSQSAVLSAGRLSQYLWSDSNARFLVRSQMFYPLDYRDIDAISWIRTRNALQRLVFETRGIPVTFIIWHL